MSLGKKGPSHLPDGPGLPSGATAQKAVAPSVVASRHSQRHVPFLQFFGDALDCLVGCRTLLLRRGLVEGSRSLVVHAQKRIAVGPADVAMIERKTVIVHVSATSSRFPRTVSTDPYRFVSFGFDAM